MHGTPGRGYTLAMPEREQELQRFRQAVERKSEHAREAAESAADAPAHAGEDDVQGDQAGLTERGRPQDAYDIRAKNSGKGKKTADKWNQ
jgi:hypothetical protein